MTQLEVIKQAAHKLISEIEALEKQEVAPKEWPQEGEEVYSPTYESGFNYDPIFLNLLDLGLLSRTSTEADEHREFLKAQKRLFEAVKGYKSGNSIINRDLIFPKSFAPGALEIELFETKHRADLDTWFAWMKKQVGYGLSPD